MSLEEQNHSYNRRSERAVSEGTKSESSKSRIRDTKDVKGENGKSGEKGVNSAKEERSIKSRKPRADANVDDFALSDPEKTALSLTELMHASLDIPSPFMRSIFLVRQVIVGTRYVGGCDEIVKDLKPGSRISFIAEPDNRFDKNAVMALDEKGRKLGYIPRHENSIIGALLRAGKSIYGIVTKELSEHGAIAPGTERTPYALWVDLYMREFLLPEDMNQIPRQGYQGSFAVTAFALQKEKDQPIGSIYAIKVINGKERAAFRRNLRRADPEKYREAISAFQKFIGYLPVVGHGITKDVLPVLEEAYGVQLGLPFSNQIIDTRQMAANHLPWVENASLKNLADELGIKISCDMKEEEYCRTTWKLYIRMCRG